MDNFTTREKIKDVNSQIQRIKAACDNEMFDTMDLKLHDLFHYCYTDDGLKKDFPLTYAENNNDGDQIFSWYCDDLYRYFIDDMKDLYNIDFNDYAHYIRSTSKFRLYKNGMDFRDDLCDIVCNIINEWSYSALTNYIDDDGNFVVDDSELEQVMDDGLDDLTDGKLYDYFIRETENIKILYDYITNDKKHQVEFFKEQMDDNESNLKYEI